MQDSSSPAAGQAAQPGEPASDSFASLRAILSSQAHAQPGRRALTKAELAHLRRAIVHTEAASAALAALCTPELVLSAEGLRELAGAASAASNSARNALRQLRPLAYDKP